MVKTMPHGDRGIMSQPDYNVKPIPYQDRDLFVFSSGALLANLAIVAPYVHRMYTACTRFVPVMYTAYTPFVPEMYIG